MLWCTWETEDGAALQKAFDEMNARSSSKSELSPITTMYPV